MKNKITLEDHFAIEPTLNDSRIFGEHVWQELGPRLTDFHEKRLRQMDDAGIEMMITSLNAPAVQAIFDVKRAIDVARAANDKLAEEVRKRPDRFAAVAALPMQDAAAAEAELIRCVRDLGFVGALVNGFSQVGTEDKVDYYDHAGYESFWATVEHLGFPFYLHPRNPLPEDSAIYEGHPWLMGPTWAFGQETAVHALRLMGSGLFDAYPKLRIIVGHMGEGLPYSMWRIDHRNGWVKAPPKYKAKKKICDYFNANFYLTTSGNFRTQTLIDSILEIGSDRILFSVDWPFENVDHASDWFNGASISEADRLKIGRKNAVELFKLGLAEPGSAGREINQAAE
jgi:2,3-dihydroxybenzoate decarboxylase